jgi:hypothetical protein
MKNEQWGLLIGAMFGMIFVLVNSDELASGIAIALRVVAVLALVGLVAMTFVRGSGRPAGGNPDRIGFTRGYWLVVIHVVHGERIERGKSGHIG